MLQCPRLEDRPRVSRPPSALPSSTQLWNYSVAEVPDVQHRPAASETSATTFRPRLTSHHRWHSAQQLPQLDSVIQARLQRFRSSPSTSLPPSPVSSVTSCDHNASTVMITPPPSIPAALPRPPARSYSVMSLDEPLPDIHIPARRLSLSAQLDLFWNGDQLTRKHWKVGDPPNPVQRPVDGIISRPKSKQNPRGRDLARRPVSTSPGHLSADRDLDLLAS
ncbi:hypothetical protein IWQ60_000639 [Tieghemiomyces parasiticus]|uniref:Uncharacterized protein n=1 Tax=Tieghemiomyces parasiticus TaxID=78921 RepID=A0A9W8ALA7_9FUNG|nr:hypothetical protein IWQ60_000639 [Tieghemiomyces parasiticus]